MEKSFARNGLFEAVAYLRTSSATNVGADKDSDKRQREAIVTFAKRAGYTIHEEFSDEAVKGGDAVDTRPGFAAMLKLIAGNGVRTIIVETANASPVISSCRRPGTGCCGTKASR